MASRIIAVLALSALLAVGLTGCGSSQDGAPGNYQCNPVGCVPVQATEESTVVGPTSAYTFIPDTSDPNDWWQSVNACALLPEAEVSQLGFSKQGHRELFVLQSSCAWETPQADLQIIFSAESYVDLLLDNYQPTDITTVDGRPGRQILATGGPNGACYVTVRATQRSRMYIRVVIEKSSSAQACHDAVVVANAVAPKLPTG